MKKEKMSKLNEWGKDKPLGLVMMAEQLEVSVETYFEFLKLIKATSSIHLFLV